MQRSDYEKALASAEREIKELLGQRAQIDARLTQLKATTESLSRLLGIVGAKTNPSVLRIADLINAVPADPGITNAIRHVLRESKIPLSVSDIKVGVEYLSVDLSAYVNPSAVLHNTLSRLERQGEVMRVLNPAGQTVAYTLTTLKQRVAQAGGVPNPFAKTLGGMLREPEKKK
jgi:hypothetical protein